jgi:Trypsin-co-occurring domain 2
MPEQPVVGVGLADAIDQVRSELVDAIDRGKDSPVAFRAGPVARKESGAGSRSQSSRSGLKGNGQRRTRIESRSH